MLKIVRFVSIVLILIAFIFPTLLQSKIARATTSPSNWFILKSYPPAVYSLKSVSCTSSTFCVAVGNNSNNSGVALTSTDGGSTWTQGSLPSAVINLNGVSCTSSTFCVAVGGNYNNSGVALTSTDGGSTWTQSSLPSTVDVFYSVSCTSSTFCVAVGSGSTGAAAFTSTDGGTIWIRDSLPSTLYYLNGVSCTSSTFCVAVGNSSIYNKNYGLGVTLRSTDGGSAWTGGSNAPSANNVTSVSCTSSTFCVAVGEGSSGAVALTSTNGGGIWTQGSLPAYVVNLNGVSCTSSTFCVAVGNDSTNKFNNNSGEAFTSTIGGFTWTQGSLSANVNNLNSVSCTSSTFCVAVGGNYNGTGAAISSTDGGSIWTQGSLPSTVYSLNGVSCTSSTFCVAVGNSNYGPGVIVTSTDGGGIWTQGSLPSTVYSLNSVSCTSSTFCVAVGGNYNNSGVTLTSTDGGSTWTQGSLPAYVVNLNGVSCTSSTFCVAVAYNMSSSGAVALTSTDGGGIWTPGSLPSIMYSLNSVSCTSSTFCVAVGENYDSLTNSYVTVFLTSTDGGSIWTGGSLPLTVNDFTGVSCASSTFCVAVVSNTSGPAGAVALTSTDGGGTWTQGSLPSAVSNLNGVSCTSSTFCLMVGQGNTSNIGALILGLVPPPPSISSISPSSGPTAGGTTVTITGSNFTNVTAVDFGIVGASSFTTNSSTSITAVSPAVASPSTVDITVTTPSGTSAIASNDQFAYIQQTYVPISPIRICDTRVNNSINSDIVNNQCNSNGTASGTLGAGKSINVGVTGTFESTNSSASSPVTIATNATAIVANITATNTTANGGFLIAYPTGSTMPNTSIVDFNANDTVPNLIQIGVGVNGDISIYNFNGNTDVVVDLEGYFIPTGTSSTTGEYVPISPVRVCDTRPLNPPSVVNNQCDTSPNGTLGSNTTIEVNVAGSGQRGTLDNVPINATAVVLNVTATNTTSNGGFLTVYPSNLTSIPNSSNLNFNSGDSVANRVLVPIDPSNGDISIYNYIGNTDVIVDVNGYYLNSNQTTPGSSFTPIVPTRICDTRVANPPSVVNNQCDTSPNGTLGSNTTIEVNVAGSGHGGTLDNVPINATAVVLNVTATNTTSNGGFLTVYPTPASGSTAPNISDLNWSQGETRANMVVVKIGTNDSINVYNAIGSADLIIDVMGYYR